jgi:hypothetical protein
MPFRVFLRNGPRGSGARRGKGGESVRKLSMRKLVASLFAGILLGVGVPFAGADAGGGPGSNHGCPGHQPPPPPNHNCGH